MILPAPENGINFIDVHCHLPFPRPKNDKLPSDEKQYTDYFKEGGFYLITCSIDTITLDLVLKFIENKINLDVLYKTVYTRSFFQMFLNNN